MLRIDLDRRSGVPLHRQLVDAVLVAAASGALEAGERLPAVRVLARELGVNANTVSKAYAELRLRGAVEARHGRGTFVCASRPRLRRAERERLTAELCQELVARAQQHGIGIKELMRELVRLMMGGGARPRRGDAGGPS